MRLMVGGSCPQASTQTVQAVAWGRSEVESAVQAVAPVFAKDGWCLELVEVAERYVTIRIPGNRSTGALPWVLKDLHRELRARLPQMAGVILVT